jgi:hypothetical protein
MTTPSPRIALLFEHPDWFRPLFTELDRRDIRYDQLFAPELSYDPRARSSPYSLVVNRMSPSAYLRGHSNGIFFVREYLRHLKEIGVEVINGYEAYMVETSKAAQLGIYESLGLPYPRARVIDHSSQAVNASAGMEYPVIVKPNIGGCGAKIQLFHERGELVTAVRSGTLDLGIDNTALVQEFLPAREGAIVRIEVLNGEFLYAIKVFPPPGEGFNLCPSDICQEEQEAMTAPTSNVGYCPATPTKRAMRIEVFVPPKEAIDAALSLAQAANLDLGGIEYLVNARDGGIYFYDINALSNFVTDAPNVVGFDPFERFVDFMISRVPQETVRH